MVVFTTRITEGGPALRLDIPDPYLAAVAGLLERAHKKHAGYVTVKLDTPRRPRSTGPRSQSAHFHGHCQSIASETGNDLADVKMYLKRKAMRRGYPVQVKDGAVVHSLCDGEPLPQSEADASVEEETMLIEEAHQLAAELGVRLVEGEEA